MNVEMTEDCSITKNAHLLVRRRGSTAVEDMNTRIVIIINGTAAQIGPWPS
jgi:hypothetical protein